MALTGIQIYKLLPQTNCKECGFPTCLAFAMKLAAKQIELSSCPYVNDAAKSQLAEASEPPVRLISVKSNGFDVQAGNEVVLFRHEKTFYHKPGIFLHVRDDESAETIKAEITRAAGFQVNYVGRDLVLDGFAVEAVSGDVNKFTAAIAAVRDVTHRPIILMSHDTAQISAGLRLLDGEHPLIYGADVNNWAAMGELAKQHSAALVVVADTLDGLTDLTEKLKDKGVNDLVLAPSSHDLGATLTLNTQIRRLALKRNFRPLGYPIMTLASHAPDPAYEAMLAAQAIAKYAGFIVLGHFQPEVVYPLLVLRENIYTDPQKPIQVKPGLYEINNPKADDPVLVTTNFSITYFSVANEVEGSGLPAWLLVTDAEGMSVLTAWAAGKFDAERIAKAVKEFGVADKVNRKRIVIPGHVALLSGELEEELPGWEIRVGPREAVDIPAFMKQVLA